MSLRQIFFVIKRHAGHSKWANIKHTKGEKDLQRSLLFGKLGQRIKVAIKENGNQVNPALNMQLASAVEYAKKCNMPVATIQSIIKSTQTDKDGAQPHKYGVRGPRGSVLLVTALTTSSKKVKQDMQFHLKKVGGIVDQSTENLFDKKGIIIASPPPNAEKVEETSVEHAIEAGAEEVSALDEDKKLTFTCGVSEFNKVKSKLEELGYQIEDAKITFVPKIVVNLNDDEMELMSNIVAKLQDIPEVTEIYDNIA